MRNVSNGWTAAALALSVGLCVTPTWAGKPDWVEDGGRNKGQGKYKERPSEHKSGQAGGTLSVGGSGLNVSIQFGDAQRSAVRDYFGPSVKAGQCPPGLAKKNNGCLPPGQAKAWKRGSPLPGGVVIYPLPRDLERRLGTPPAGHKYVRVAADILLIAVGTSMVVDAIEDLAGL